MFEAAFDAFPEKKAEQIMSYGEFRPITYEHSQSYWVYYFGT